jgi:hypothetical protein
MQERHLYEYAIVRWVPQVERDEFINIGVIVYCSGKKYLSARFELDQDRLRAFHKSFGADELQQHVDAIKNICAGDSEGGPIAALDAPSRFRWLTAVRSTVVQTSRVHPGYCFSPDETLDKIFKQQVSLD